MKLMASTTLSAVVKRQYSSVLLSLRYCLPVFDKIYVMAMDLVFFVWVTLIKIASTTGQQH